MKFIRRLAGFMPRPMWTQVAVVLADDEQWAKLKEIVEISKDVWGK